MTGGRGVKAVVGEELEAILPAHVGQQRWYGGSPDDDLRILRTDLLEPPWPGLLRVVVESPTGDRYQVLVGLRQPDPGVESPIGMIGLPEGEALCVDATVDPELALVLLRYADPTQDATIARPIGAEQSNTSIVYDERLILKVFRRLVGVNPEVEMTSALGRAGFTHVATPISVWREDGDDLAILQPFLVGGAEGWALALTSLRALLDEGGDPAESGADFAPEAERLGAIAAEMHLALADALGASAGDAAAWVDAITDRARVVPVADVDASDVAARLEIVRAIGDAGAAIRVHGDFHLGQVMQTDEGWYVLDFEGEPTRPVEERRRPASPLRDVAGMLRSISYAAAIGVREHRLDEMPEPAVLWERRNRDAFLASYLDRLGGSALLPADPSSLFALLDAFELEKALYEVAYESAHRPDWVGIPLAAALRLLGRRAP